MVGQIQDQALIEQVAAGDRAALGELYDRYSGAMMAVGLRRLRDRQEVEDVLHDVFMEVWAKAHSYDSERASVRTWLFVRMRSRILDAARKVRRTRVDSLGDPETLDSPLISPNNPSKSAQDTEMRRLTANLPDRLSRVIALTYFTGLTSAEVAEQLDIPQGTVKSRLRAARQALRVELADGEGGTK